MNDLEFNLNLLKHSLVTFSTTECCINVMKNPNCKLLLKCIQMVIFTNKNGTNTVGKLSKFSFKGGGKAYLISSKDEKCNYMYFYLVLPSCVTTPCLSKLRYCFSIDDKKNSNFFLSVTKYFTVSFH